MDTLQIEARTPQTVWVFAAITAGLLTLGFFQQEPNWFIGAVLPLAMAFALWLRKGRDFNLIFGPESVYGDFEELFAYQDIVGVTISGATPDADADRFPSGTLIVTENQNEHRFPISNRNTMRQAYSKLIDRIPCRGSQAVCQTLVRRLKNDLATFDDDLVFSYVARLRRKAKTVWPDAVCYLLLVVGVVWFIIGNLQRRFENWIPAGVILAFLVVIFEAVRMTIASRERVRVPDADQAGMVVSPRGIALNQGHLNGNLKWEEIQSITCGKVASGSLVIANTPRGICIRVAGAQFLVYDIYDRPLAIIYRSMLQFWEEE